MLKKIPHFKYVLLDLAIHTYLDEESWFCAQSSIPFRYVNFLVWKLHMKSVQFLSRQMEWTYFWVRLGCRAGFLVIAFGEAQWGIRSDFGKTAPCLNLEQDTVKQI